MSSIETLIDNSRVSRVQVFVVVVCFLLNVLDGFDVAAIAYVGPVIIDSWNVSPGSLGIAFSTGLVGTALGAMFVAPWADRAGRRTLILVSLVVIGVSMAATGFVRNVSDLAIIRGVNGIGVGSLLAAITALGTEVVPARHRNLVVSIISSGFLVGAAAGGVVASQVIAAYGWQAVFFLGAFFAALMFVLVWWQLPESPAFLVLQRASDGLQRVNRVLRKLKLQPLSEMPVPDRNTGSEVGVRALFEPGFRLATCCIWAAFCLTFLTLYFVQSWLPKILVDIGFSVSYAAYGGVALNLGGLLGILILGCFSARVGVGRMVRSSLAAAATIMIMMRLLPEGEIVMLLAISVLGLFTMNGFIGLYVVVAQLYPTRLRATGIGWAIGAGRFGSVVSPLLGGYIIGVGWRMEDSFALFAVPLFAAAIAIFFLYGRGSVKPAVATQN
ncbi:MAG TPA: 4-hydroxybenzoate transporter [Spongiibacteraceae bacterium]|nr:4-hydroxybenzoate transporter [Spongiibacteraceae bacterium]HCS26827.1 4-hydroxybenzoate transporter [Spongiibacteraceae bacterium]